MSRVAEDLLRGQIDLYGKVRERWRVEHEIAMACRDLEDLLAFGLQLYEKLSSLDVEYHEGLFLEGVPYDERHAGAIRNLFQEWLDVSEDIRTGSLAKLEAAGFRVNRAEEFRGALREVKGVLTDDAEFFAGNPQAADRLAEARDRALDGHRRGETVPLEAPRGR